MRTHPEVGERILRPIQSLQPILPIVRHHHERWDGTGYPDRLIGRAIPLGARIVAVCDAYRAMTEDRPYRARSTAARLADELREVHRQPVRRRLRRRACCAYSSAAPTRQRWSRCGRRARSRTDALYDFASFQSSPTPTSTSSGGSSG